MWLKRRLPGISSPWGRRLPPTVDSESSEDPPQQIHATSSSSHPNIRTSHFIQLHHGPVNTAQVTKKEKKKNPDSHTNSHIEMPRILIATTISAQGGKQSRAFMSASPSARLHRSLNTAPSTCSFPCPPAHAPPFSSSPFPAIAYTRAGRKRAQMRRFDLTQGHNMVCID